jgi:hypothetical protein
MACAVSQTQDRIGPGFGLLGQFSTKPLLLIIGAEKAGVNTDGSIASKYCGGAKVHEKQHDNV